jgi:XTP/dITP diphosphohydrolase
MQVFVATNNAGKFTELQAIFGRFGWMLERHAAYRDVVEGDTSYAANAALKAQALATLLHERKTPAAVLGDDSGLEVAALGGRPGVLSARYGGPTATWSERRRALLEELAATGTTDRRARFVCALHLIRADGRAFSVERGLAGEIASHERGAGGFSYDPLFVYVPLGLTFGELDERTKNAVSHRAAAVQALVEANASAGAGSPDISTRAGKASPTGT